MGTHKPPANDVARRVLAVMAYCGKTSQVDFAKWLKLSSAQRLGNVIRGTPLGKDLAYKIAKKVPGLTPMWLWDGEGQGMPWGLLEKLNEHLDALEAEPHHGAS